MPTIDMSAGFASGISNRIIRIGDGGSNVTPNAAISGLLASSAYGFSSSGVNSYLFIMKGAVPTAANLANYAARASDVLITFTSYYTPVGGDFQTSNVGGNPAIISTSYVGAGASGTATWFWWMVLPGINYSTQIHTTATPVQQIIGTVGITGSGSDLEIPNTTITAGEAYRFLNLRIQFPTTWTY